MLCNPVGLQGKYVKLQPFTSDFLDISNPKAVLERTLRTYTCLTVRKQRDAAGLATDGCRRE